MPAGEGLNVCTNYEFNLLHHVAAVAKRVCAAAAETAAHEGDNNTPSGPTGRGLKSTGPSTEPCGTRYESVTLSDRVSLIFTHWCLFCK